MKKRYTNNLGQDELQVIKYFLRGKLTYLIKFIPLCFDFKIKIWAQKTFDLVYFIYKLKFISLKHNK